MTDQLRWIPVLALALGGMACGGSSAKDGSSAVDGGVADGDAADDAGVGEDAGISDGSLLEDSGPEPIGDGGAPATKVASGNDVFFQGFVDDSHLVFSQVSASDAGVRYYWVAPTGGPATELASSPFSGGSTIEVERDVVLIHDAFERVDNDGHTREFADLWTWTVADGIHQASNRVKVGYDVNAEEFFTFDRVSPSGTKILFTLADEDDAGSAVFKVANPDFSGAVTIMTAAFPTDTAARGYPLASFAGSRVIVGSAALDAFTTNLYSYAFDGSDPQRLDHGGAAQVYAFTWSGDGSKVLLLDDVTDHTHPENASHLYLWANDGSGGVTDVKGTQVDADSFFINHDGSVVYWIAPTTGFWRFPHPLIPGDALRLINSSGAGFYLLATSPSVERFLFTNDLLDLKLAEGTSTSTTTGALVCAGAWPDFCSVAVDEYNEPASDGFSSDSSRMIYIHHATETSWALNVRPVGSDTDVEIPGGKTAVMRAAAGDRFVYCTNSEFDVDGFITSCDLHLANAVTGATTLIRTGAGPDYRLNVARDKIVYRIGQGIEAGLWLAALPDV